MTVQPGSTLQRTRVAAALGRTVDLEEVVRVQGELVSAGLERWSQLDSFYLALVRAAIVTPADEPRALQSG